MAIVKGVNGAQGRLLFGRARAQSFERTAIASLMDLMRKTISAIRGMTRATTRPPAGSVHTVCFVSTLKKYVFRLLGSNAAFQSDGATPGGDGAAAAKPYLSASSKGRTPMSSKPGSRITLRSTSRSSGLRVMKESSSFLRNMRGRWRMVSPRRLPSAHRRMAPRNSRVARMLLSSADGEFRRSKVIVAAVNVPSGGSHDVTTPASGFVSSSRLSRVIGRERMEGEISGV